MSNFPDFCQLFVEPAAVFPLRNSLRTQCDMLLSRSLNLYANYTVKLHKTKTRKQNSVFMNAGNKMTTLSFIQFVWGG